MTFAEKKLYHQIHPLKLFTDWSTGFIAVYFCWYHALWIALLIMFVPSIIITYLLITFADLQNLKKSPFGKYVKKYMSPKMEIIRFAGYFVMVLGAWTHIVLLIPLGLLIILAAWCRGLLK
jgi:hypothetical protein